MHSNCGAREDSWGSLGQKGDQTSQSSWKSVLNIHWKDWCWSSNTLATWCEVLIHWKRPWCWEILKAGGEGDNRGWDGWMASSTQWTWVWANSKSWWWTAKSGLLQSMGSQTDGQDWVAELNWTESQSPSPGISKFLLSHSMMHVVVIHGLSKYVKCKITNHPAIIKSIPSIFFFFFCVYIYM